MSAKLRRLAVWAVERLLKASGCIRPKLRMITVHVRSLKHFKSFDITTCLPELAARRHEVTSTATIPCANMMLGTAEGARSKKA